MRSVLILGALLASGMSQARAMDAAAASELAKASGCYSCHSAKEKIVGPAFSSIAEKYAGNKDAAVSLTQSIQMGSQGKWGRVAMPAHPNMNVADIKQLAAWVLTIKP